MARVQIGDKFFETALIVFDKDGTLVDLHHMWGDMSMQWIDAMLEPLSQDRGIGEDLYRSLGYDPLARRIVANSPMAVACTQDLYAVAATVLCQHGHPWHEAIDIVRSAAKITIELPRPDQIRPLGDVGGTIRRLAAAGIIVAIATSDDRAITEATLPILGIGDAVGLLVCGDDALPNKPDPAGLHFLSRQTRIAPSQIMMVGDTTSDMLFGKNAGVGCCVGIVHNGELGPDLADVLVSSIDEILLV